MAMLESAYKLSVEKLSTVLGDFKNIACIKTEESCFPFNIFISNLVFNKA